jgi:hypothetical protein
MDTAFNFPDTPRSHRKVRWTSLLSLKSSVCVHWESSLRSAFIIATQRRAGMNVVSTNSAQQIHYFWRYQLLFNALTNVNNQDHLTSFVKVMKYLVGKWEIEEQLDSQHIALYKRHLTGDVTAVSWSPVRTLQAPLAECNHTITHTHAVLHSWP